MSGDVHDILKIAAGVLIALTIRGVFIFSFEIIEQSAENRTAVKAARWIALISLLAGIVVLWLAVAGR